MGYIYLSDALWDLWDGSFITASHEWSFVMQKASPSWWRLQMETFSALLALCAGNSPVTCEFAAQRPVTRSFGVFFDLRLNKRLSEAGELRCQLAHYDVIVMIPWRHHIIISQPQAHWYLTKHGRWSHTISWITFSWNHTYSMPMYTSCFLWYITNYFEITNDVSPWNFSVQKTVLVDLV